MKSAGHTFIASLTPVHSVVLKNHGRLFPDLIYGNHTKSRKLRHYHHKCQFHKQYIMGATRYPPPWFRQVFFPLFGLFSESFGSISSVTALCDIQYCSDDGIHGQPLQNFGSPHIETCLALHRNACCRNNSAPEGKFGNAFWIFFLSFPVRKMSTGMKSFMRNYYELLKLYTSFIFAGMPIY